MFTTCSLRAFLVRFFGVSGFFFFMIGVNFFGRGKLIYLTIFCSFLVLVSLGLICLNYFRYSLTLFARINNSCYKFFVSYIYHINYRHKLCF